MEFLEVNINDEFKYVNPIQPADRQLYWINLRRKSRDYQAQLAFHILYCSNRAERS